MYRRSTWLAAVVVISLLACSRAHAQGDPDPNLKPTFGAVTLKAGFLPDPFTKDLQAGGDLKTNLGGVNAFVARAPDFSLNYTAGKYALTFHVKSVGDTTLLINLPDGSWIADDDSGGNLDPLIRIAKPTSGRYDIFVGTYRKGILPATLHITERKVNAEVPTPVVIDKNAPACYIVSAGVDNYRNANKLNGCLNDARNTVAAFRSHLGAQYSKVDPQILLDAQASHANILGQFQGLTRKGAPRDFMVLFLSGHGGRTNGDRVWNFLPFDFNPQRSAQTLLTDRRILEAGDAIAKQNKHVVIIVDACFCGQLYQTAQPYLQRYQNPKGGSMTLMLSSAANQTSAALGNYSAFAKAFFDAMAGGADLNGDGKITLGEIKAYTQRRTAELLMHSRIKQRQDCIVVWSPSLSADTPLGRTGKAVASTQRPAPTGNPTRWAGTENLAGYGKLSFALYPDGRVIMVDAKETSQGIWRQENNRYTLSFNDGAVVYAGTLNGNTLGGTATSPAPRTEALRSWQWSVTRQGN
jgi:hypothetical protein